MPARQLRLADVRSTSAFRSTLLLGTLFLSGLIVTLALVYWLTVQELTGRSDRILYGRAQTLLATKTAALPARIVAEIGNAAPGVSYFALVAQNGEPIAGNFRLRHPPRLDRPFNADGETGPVRILALRTRAGETVILGRDTSQIRDFTRHMLAILAASGVIGALGTLMVAMLLSLGPMRRVRDLQDTAHAIADGDLTRRMPIAGRHDELDQFATTVNQMVEEVGHVIGQVKAATDGVAHDLRTPLTRVRATLHQMRHFDLAEEPDQMLGEAIDDLEAIVDRLGALLRLSELEAGGRRSGLEPVALAPLLAEIVELYGPLAEERGVALACSARGGESLAGDRQLLFEAIGNLVDNAIKFAATRVDIAVEAGPMIAVTDDGPGIPASEHEAVLRRFYRSVHAADTPGTGLGLSVVAAIIRLHGFVLDLDDAGPGLIARVGFRRPGSAAQ